MDDWEFKYLVRLAGEESSTRVEWVKQHPEPPLGSTAHAVFAALLGEQVHGPIADAWLKLVLQHVDRKNQD